MTSDQSAAPGKNGGLLRWLRGISPIYAALNAAILAVSIVVPDRLVPEPIAPLRVVAGVVIGVTIIAGYLRHATVRRHAGGLIALALGSTVILALLNAFFVVDVSFANPKQDTYCLVGWAVQPASIATYDHAPAVEIIRDAGGDAIASIWGWTFYATAIVYVLSYLGLIVGLVLLVSPASSPKRRSG